MREWWHSNPSERDKLHTDEVIWDEFGLPHTLEGRIIVPSDTSFTNTIIRESHDAASAGHLGPDRTLARVATLFTWPGLASDVFNYCRTCENCQKCKKSNRKPLGLLHPIPPPESAWQEIQLEFLSLPTDADTGLDALLVVCDRLSRRIRLVPCPNDINAEDTAKLLLTHVVKLHGMPRRIISDRDPRFTGEVWQHLFLDLGVHLTFSSYHPQTNGLTERANRTVLQLLRNYCEELNVNWSNHIDSLEIAYNSSLHSSRALHHMKQTAAGSLDSHYISFQT